MEFQGHLESVARAVIRQHIPGDAVEPRSEGGSRLEAPRIAEHPKKDLLDEIFAQCFLSGEAEEKPIEWSVVAIKENSQTGFAMARLHAGHQFRVIKGVQQGLLDQEYQRCDKGLRILQIFSVRGRGLTLLDWHLPPRSGWCALQFPQGPVPDG